jgi:hypothetical protein
MNFLTTLSRTRGIWFQCRPRTFPRNARSFLGWGKTTKKVEETESESGEDTDSGLTFKTIMLPSGVAPDPGKTALCVEIIGARQVFLAPGVKCFKKKIPEQNRISLK